MIERVPVAQRLQEFRVRATETLERVRVAVLGEDPTAWPRKRLEQALALVLAASHDLKAPLAGLYGWTRTLRQSWRELDEAQRVEMLDRMQDEIARLSRMLENVLATARLGVRPATGPVDLGDAVETAVREAKMLRPDREVVVSVLNSVSVEADQARLGRILANLIDNAMKYSPDGEKVKVRVLGSDLEGRVIVQDHGLGMTPDEARQVFDAFSRTTAAERSGAVGQGLGLFLTSSFVRDLGGRIEVDTTPGRGSTFMLRLPRASSEASDQGERAE